MHHPISPLEQARAWIRAGVERLRQEPARWLGMTLVYLVIALLLKRIPFFGNYVLALLTPTALASAILAARTPPGPPPVDARGWLRALTTEAFGELVQVFRREEHAFAAIIVSIVTLGIVVLVSIPELLITGGSIISGIAGASLAGPIQPMTIFSILVAIALYTVLAMALLYLVPLALLGQRQAIPAVAESFRVCLIQRKTLALFVAPFFALNLFLMIIFSLSHWLGYLLLFSLGVIALPVFVLGVVRSYETLFETEANRVA